MALYGFVFSEISPSAPGTSASSGYVQNASNALAGGIAGPADDGNGIDILAILKGATGGLLDVYIQSGTPDGNWFDLIHFAQLAAGASQIVYRTNISALALNASTGGTSSSAATPNVIGMNTTPALGAALAVQGQGFDRLRLLMVAGSGTSAGAAVKVYATVQRPFAAWQS